jgi:uncharacterized membrane protein YccC
MVCMNVVDTDREDWSLGDGERNMPRSEAKLAVAQVGYRPVNDTQTARSPMTIVGFPLSVWGFALRTWVAMMVALYVAFWLQLDNAWSAAVTVSILSMQTRGQTYQRAVYWILAAIIGVVASLMIGGMFPQSRELFVIGLAGCLGLCVYAAGLLDSNRAYVAILCGYTVAQVAVPQIDSPENIFSAGVNRGAAIVVGIAALVLVSEVFAAPNVHPGLVGKLTAAHRRVRAFALAALRGESAGSNHAANLLREITALHADITALAAESSDGGARGAAARIASVALVAEVSAARALQLPGEPLPSLRRELGGALVDDLGEENRALQVRLRRRADDDYVEPREALFARYGLDLLIENQRAQNAIEDLQAGRSPQRRIRAPICRSRQSAMRNGLRGCLAILISAILLSLGGWPFASQGLAVVGSIVALSANTPNLHAFSASAVIAMVIAALLAGVMEFLILDGVDQFPLLAIGMAPSILSAALYSTKHGFLVLVFVPVILSPTNPQSYNPEAYLYSSLMAIMAAILLFVPLRIVLPTSDALRRRWCLTSARAEMRGLLAGGQSRQLDDEALFRDADRIGQLAALQPAADDERRDDLRQALDVFGRAAAVRRVRTTLGELSARTGGRMVREGYSALAAGDSSGLRRAATDLAGATNQLDHDGQAKARTASLDLIWAALLIDASPFGFDGRRWSTP